MWVERIPKVKGSEYRWRAQRLYYAHGRTREEAIKNLLSIKIRTNGEGRKGA